MRKLLASVLILQALAPFAHGGARGFQRERRAVSSPQAQASGSRVVANQMPGADLGAKINAADAALGSRAGEIIVNPAQGAAGSIDTQVTISGGHTLRFSPGVYRSSFQDRGPDGIIRLKSNSAVVGSGWETILRESSRPTVSGSYNHWTVFINYEGSLRNEAAATNIRISDLKIEGAADAYNSAPQTVALGNCRGCSVERVWLKGTKTIGIQAGGGNADGNHARDVRIADNLLENVASQSLACVNCVNVSFLNNRIKNPGAATLAAGPPPGNVPIDLEPNSPADMMLNVTVEGNVVDASGSLSNCGGGTPCTLHGIAVQGSGVAPARFSARVRNNRVIGAAITDPSPHIIGVGIWVNGAPNTVVERNYVQRTYDGIKVSSASNFSLIANEVVSTGFTSNISVHIEGTNVSGVVRDNVVRVDPRSALAHGEDSIIVETATSGAVTYSSNRAADVQLSLRASRVVNGAR